MRVAHGIKHRHLVLNQFRSMAGSVRKKKIFGIVLCIHEVRLMPTLPALCLRRAIHTDITSISF